MIKLSDVVRFDRNPKNHRLDRLDESFDRFGFVAPLLVDDTSGSLVAGHGRLEALQNRKSDGSDPPDGIDVAPDGEWLVPVIRGVGFDNDDEALAYLLADNRLSEVGAWDDSALRDILDDFVGRDLADGIGWSDDELNQLLDRLDPDATGGDAGPVPELSTSKPIAIPGDVWICGDHRIICGDATDDAVIVSLMAGATADMVFTDPPYNIDYGNIKHPKFRVREIANDNMTAGDYGEFAREIAATIALYCTGCVYVCGAPGPDGRILFGALDDALHCSTVVIWNKDCFTLGRGKYHNKYEPIWFGWPSTVSAIKFSGSRRLANVWDIDRPKASRDHPTMKPISLCSTAIKHGSRKGDIVLDLFGGSGSTMISCEDEGRRCRTVELDPRYVDVMVRRWQSRTGQDAYRADGESFNDAAAG